MPFKGDMRLGGRRRNDSTLDGTSEGPSYPAAGTVLRQESGLQWPIASGGPSTSYENSEYPSKYGTFNVKADGIGGEYIDYSVALQSYYYPQGTHITTIAIDVPIYVYVQASNDSYQSGTVNQSLQHDGSGGSGVVNTNAVYVSSGTEFYQTASPVNATYGGQTYQVGNGTLYYYHNGNGGYYTAMNFVNYTSANTVVGTYSSGNTIGINVGGDLQNYPNGTTSYNVVTDGTGGLNGEFASATYPSAGTIFVTSGSYSYTADGSGYYGVFTAYGTWSSNVSSNTNYIDISGNQYQNGSVSEDMYHNGAGGYYSQNSYSYLPYGETITSVYSGDDENGNPQYTYYYSNGTGGYYT